MIRLGLLHACCVQVAVGDRVQALAGLLKEAMETSRNAAYAPLAVRATAFATASLQVWTYQHPEKSPIVVTGLQYRNKITSHNIPYLITSYSCSSGFAVNKYVQNWVAPLCRLQPINSC
jgi:hypothetical protein